MSAFGQPLRAAPSGNAFGAYGGRVRLTYFRELMDGEFGPARAAALARDHVFAQLGDRTVEKALEFGFDPREVWKAVCEVYDVPHSRR